jgi:hypothetical protein
MPPVAGLSPAALVAALPPGGTTTRLLHVSNTGASDLTWALAGPGDGVPGALASWIAASPAEGILAAGAQADITLTISAATLVDGDHAGLVCLYSNDPVRTRLDTTVALHVGEIAPDLFQMEPATLNLQSNGNTVKGMLQFAAGIDPQEVVLESVRLNGMLPPLVPRTSFEDGNGDGRLELILKFDRQSVQALLPEGQAVPVTVTGEVRDRTWFRATAILRIIRPRLTAPNGGESLLAGQAAAITWLAAPAQTPLYDVILSRDGGQTWETLAADLMGTSLVWIPSGEPTSRARVRVLAHDSQGVMGYDESDADFTVAGQLLSPDAVNTLRVALNAAGEALLTWDRPPVDEAHGPVTHYKVLASATANGGYTVLGTPAVESWTAPGGGGSGPIIYFKVVAVNAAGESGG